jgi:hypothetical protein
VDPAQEVLEVRVVQVVVAEHNFLHQVQVLLAPVIVQQPLHHKEIMVVLVELVLVAVVVELVPLELLV